MEYQYLSTIMAEWDLVCDNSWKPPISTSVYIFGMMVGFMSGGEAIYLATILGSASDLAVTFTPNLKPTLPCAFYYLYPVLLKLSRYRLLS